jgi:hypothetical protein
MLEDPDRKVRGFAALALLDRGYGKPRQTIESDGPPSLSMMHLIAARSISDKLQSALEAGTAPPTIDGIAEPQQRRNAQPHQPNGSDIGMPIDLSTPALE